MLFQLLVPSSNSVLRTAAQKFLDEGLAALGTVPRIFDAWVDDLFVYREGIFWVLAKGQFPAEEFVSDDSQGPEVNWEAVPLSGDDLGGDVVGRADDGAGPEPALYF
jgi:hypothetical protein